MSTAAAQIRESVAALPEYMATDAITSTRPAVWYAVGRYVSVKGHGVVLHADDPNVDEHVALLASPHVATALADLLDAIPPTLDFPATVDPWELITTIWARADTLRAALSRQPEPGATP